jgi:integrase
VYFLHLFHLDFTKLKNLSPNVEQLNFLIHDEKFSRSLPFRLEKIKDIFVFGCAVGLRVSDLMRLNKSNLDQNYESYFIKIFSKKTGTFTRIKLPEYAVSIIKKYNGKFPTLLPRIHLYTLNKYSRELAEKAGWTYPADKVRRKKGIIMKIKTASRKQIRFCDLITSHTMRRTAITTYLQLGMPEQLVRRISGHSSTSKEFFRYVKYSEELFESELDKAHAKFAQKHLSI